MKFTLLATLLLRSNLLANLMMKSNLLATLLLRSNSVPPSPLAKPLLPRLPRSARVGAGEAMLLAHEVAAVLLLAPRSGDGLFARPLGAPLFCRVGNWIGSVLGNQKPSFLRL